MLSLRRVADFQFVQPFSCEERSNNFQALDYVFTVSIQLHWKPECKDFSMGNDSGHDNLSPKESKEEVNNSLCKKEKEGGHWDEKREIRKRNYQLLTMVYNYILTQVKKISFLL